MFPFQLRYESNRGLDIGYAMHTTHTHTHTQRFNTVRYVVTNCSLLLQEDDPAVTLTYRWQGRVRPSGRCATEDDDDDAAVVCRTIVAGCPW